MLAARCRASTRPDPPGGMVRAERYAAHRRHGRVRGRRPDGRVRGCGSASVSVGQRRQGDAPGRSPARARVATPDGDRPRAAAADDRALDRRCGRGDARCRRQSPSVRARETAGMPLRDDAVLFDTQITAADQARFSERIDRLVRGATVPTHGVCCRASSRAQRLGYRAGRARRRGLGKAFFKAGGWRTGMSTRSRCCSSILAQTMPPARAGRS